MNTSEAAKVLYTLKAAFPNSYKFSQKEKENGLSKSIVELWAASFDDMPFQQVYDAVLGWISTENRGFPPSIGQIKNMIVKISGEKEFTEVQAWGCVKKALKNSLYDSIKEFDAMPEIVKLSVGSPEMLKSWAQVSLDELETVIQSNFMRTFRAKNVMHKEVMMIPLSVREKMDQIMVEGESRAKIENFNIPVLPERHVEQVEHIENIMDYVKLKAGESYG